ncbi:MAG: hypothetical protein QN198_07830 [Armatimonadota bacterium]|nr:hypothetical protein [Armatimonadota bacterium]MDR5703497.1 hypothetical protein [Armatimonadota bacterium]
MGASGAQRTPLRQAVQIGLIFGVVGVYLSLVGMVETFHGRAVIAGVISLGQALLLLTGLGAGFVVARRIPKDRPWHSVAYGALAGSLAGLVLFTLPLLGNFVHLRSMFVNASPTLFELLTFGRGLVRGGLLLLVVGAFLGMSSVLILRIPRRILRPVGVGVTTIFLVSLFQEQLEIMLAGPEAIEEIRRFLFDVRGLTIPGASFLLVVTAVGNALWAKYRESIRQRANQLPAAGQKSLRALLLVAGILLVLILPIVTGSFFAQVLVFVGLYTLMGFGLNVDLGFAGLFDLGFVAFFAIGAYTAALLTSQGPLGIAHISFWGAIPIVVLMSLLAGVMLGVPVLGIRGDYLAIATLGFGEIIRLLVLSDFLRPWLGGSQGILEIPKPMIFGFELATPQQIFYVTVIFCVVVAYIAWRLRDSRIGRAWIAIREDEDVAAAMGINLINAKLLAFGIGASFAGVAGAIFASMVGSVFPHSFNLFISINVLALLIVGGLGSLPGVVVGSLALIGLPELLREFSEFRLLVYGAALVAMMLLRPEGLWPEPVRRRELREFEPGVQPVAEEALAGTKGQVEVERL